LKTLSSLETRLPSEPCCGLKKRDVVKGKESEERGAKEESKSYFFFQVPL
jgi:hypothetical protein